MPKIFRRLWQDGAGTLTHVMAIAAVPVMGLVGLAVDHGRQVAGGSEVHAILEEACSRTRSSFFAPRPVNERLNAAEAVIAMRTGHVEELESVTFSANAIAQEVVVAANGTVGAGMSSIVGAGALPVDVVLKCGTDSAAPPSENCVILLDPNAKRALHVHETQIDAANCAIYVASDDNEAAVVHAGSNFLLRSHLAWRVRSMMGR